MESAMAQAIREAGQLMLAARRPRVYDKAGHANFVSETDVAVQELLMTRLAALYPGARFFAEEKQDNVLTDGLTFIIDPIDGTMNFLRHRRTSAISVGAVEHGKPVLGMIYDPYRDELYAAEAGKGAYCGETRLRVSDEPLERALIGLGTSPYYGELTALTGRTVAALMTQAADLRRTGSAALELCDIAAGRSDGCFEWLLQPWDYCAGALLVQEAGGRCGNILGGEATYEAGIPFMAANARCYEPLRQALLAVRAAE